MTDNTLVFPLEERIGSPDLFVVRKALQADYDKWISLIPKKLSKSRALLARKKSGKSAFVQRIFNQLWSSNGPVIPFYLEILEQRIWYPLFAISYYRAFASQYISFLERDKSLVRMPLSLDEIREYGQAHDMRPFVRDVDDLEKYQSNGSHDLMWQLAHTAPHRYASFYAKPVLVIIDEFQNLNGFICTDQDKTNIDTTMPGSYHEHSESKVAPMLVTGSAVGLLVNVIDEYLQGGRLSKMWFGPCLTEEEGLEAVYRYATAYAEPITNETALLINQLTYSDPFFISCVIRSGCPERDLASRVGVLRCVDYEVGNRNAELAFVWMVYLRSVTERINQHNAKKILLFLTRHHDQTYTPLQLKKELALDLEPAEILERLNVLHRADLILDTPSQTEWQGQRDGTFYLVLQQRFKHEMELLNAPKEGLGFRYDSLREKHGSLQGAYNQTTGRLAEYRLAWDMRDRSRFPLSVYFNFPNPTEAGKMEVIEVFMRHHVQDSTGKTWEVDVQVDGADDLTLLVEVKNRVNKVGIGVIDKLKCGAAVFAHHHPERRVVVAVLSLSGFTTEALNCCRDNNIGWATEINWYRKEWS